MAKKYAFLISGNYFYHIITVRKYSNFKLKYLWLDSNLFPHLDINLKKFLTLQLNYTNKRQKILSGQFDLLMLNISLKISLKIVKNNLLGPLLNLKLGNMITICENSSSLNLWIFLINKKEDVLSLLIIHFLFDYYLFTLKCIKVYSYLI